MSAARPVRAVSGEVGRLLALDEVAQVLGCSRRTVERRIASGLMPAFRDGRLVRVPFAELVRYMADRTALPRPRRAGRRVPDPPSGGRLWD